MRTMCPLTMSNSSVYVWATHSTERLDVSAALVEMASDDCSRQTEMLRLSAHVVALNRGYMCNLLHANNCTCNHV